MIYLQLNKSIFVWRIDELLLSLSNLITVSYEDKSVNSLPKFDINNIEHSGNSLKLFVSFKSKRSQCPVCKSYIASVHDSYTRVRLALPNFVPCYNDYFRTLTQKRVEGFRFIEKSYVDILRVNCSITMHRKTDVYETLRTLV